MGSEMCIRDRLNDRGLIKEGLKADLVRLSIKNDLPIIRKVWASGREVA